jgi:hypothetical protein
MRMLPPSPGDLAFVYLDSSPVQSARPIVSEIVSEIVIELELDLEVDQDSD